MPTEIVNLDERWQAEVLSYLRRSPYRNSLPLANVTQLRAHCDVVLAHYNGQVVGMASYYRDLPFVATTFAVDLPQTLPLLHTALAEQAPILHQATLSTVIPEQRVRQLAACTTIESVELEMQMVVEPETLRPHSDTRVRRLRSDDLAAMGELARGGGLMAWRPAVFDHGPAFGAFVDERLAAMATTHFATTDVIEIGNVVTHPDFRRQGLASACVSALAANCFNLAPRVYLLVMDNNPGAQEAYRKLGFWPSERFAFVHYQLPLMRAGGGVDEAVLLA
ncbi:GNAT family N-acetyltransferase [Candidatus Gracilibacteria bacterium]|nr:GNAT family N-acetyltransferase [Candidatus Gracilibacteria bacterium]